MISKHHTTKTWALMPETVARGEGAKPDNWLILLELNAESGSFNIESRLQN